MKKIITISIAVGILVGVWYIIKGRDMPATMPFGVDTNFVGGDAVPTSGNEDVQISAIGTEPFWGFAYQQGRLIWTMPAQDETGDIQTKPLQIGYSADEANTIITLRGLGEAKFNAKITKETCSDGMSDNIYTHKVQVSFEGVVYTGCANVEKRKK